MAETSEVSVAGGQSGIEAAKAGSLATGLVDGMVRKEKGGYLNPEGQKAGCQDRWVFLGLRGQRRLRC